MWKRKKNPNLYHEEVITTNSRDIIDGIDTLLNTCVYDYQAANPIPWQDISKMQTSPNDCRFTADLHVPQNSPFASKRVSIEVNIAVSQQDRATEIRVYFNSKLKTNFWNLHAAKDLLDKLAPTCGSASTAPPDPAGDFRVIANTIVMDLKSSYASASSTVGSLPPASVQVLRLIATAKPKPKPTPQFHLSDVAEMADAMVMRHLATFTTSHAMVGHQRCFVPVTRDIRESWMGISVKEVWVAYQYPNAK